MDEEFKSRDTLQKEAADWRWRYRETNNKLDKCLKEAAELREQMQLMVEERELLSERLHQLSRYETASVLMGALAYDFNNLLTVIKGYSEMMHEQLGDVVMQAEVEEVIKASDRAAGIVKQLLALQLSTAQVQVKEVLSENVEKLS